MTSLSSLSISEMASGLDAKKFTSVELTTACLESIKKAKQLNAFLELSEDSALNTAAASDSHRAQGVSKPLLGIPVAVKDMILTQGIKTTCASRILSNFIPPYDATDRKSTRLNSSH